MAIVIILVLIIIVLNVIVLFITIREANEHLDEHLVVNQDDFPNDQNTRTNGAENNNRSRRKKHIVLPAITAALGIAAILFTFFTIGVNPPIILPLDGMLTEEYPNVEIRYENALPFAETYYSDNPRVIPSEAGIKYTGPFEPEKSGTYYAQTKFLLSKSTIKHFTVITYQDSIDKYGKQEGELSQATEAPDINFFKSSVSQEKSTDYNSLPIGISSGWGDNSGGRAGYTIQDINDGKLFDQIIFNTITDGTIGDERNFCGARENRIIEPGDVTYWNANICNVEVGKEYYIRIYGHNNSPKGYERVAEDVKLQFQVPPESGRSIAIHGLISSSNAIPSLYWDGVVLTSDEIFRVEYIPGSAIIENNGFSETKGMQLSDNIVNSWETIGYNQLDGRIPGCYQYSFFAVIKVRIVGVAAQD